MRRLALGFLLLLAACPNGLEARDGGAPIPDAAPVPGIAFVACESPCMRPGDCFVAYPDSGYCPAGFLCAARFSCTVDGGTTD
jgi:hypothetical protein